MKLPYQATSDTLIPLYTIILKDKVTKNVRIRVSYPSIKFPCNFGTDKQTAKKFIARDGNAGEIVSLMGADFL